MNLKNRIEKEMVDIGTLKVHKVTANRGYIPSILDGPALTEMIPNSRAIATTRSRFLLCSSRSLCRVPTGGLCEEDETEVCWVSCQHQVIELLIEAKSRCCKVNKST